MSKIRILIVDDAVVVRRLITDALTGDPDIEVVGSAANGRIALQKIPQVNPDLVTLDVEMPEMDGLTTLVELRKAYPLLPVIMFSTLTERGAGTTLDALSRGATDYVTKPANVGSVGEGIQRVRSELIPKVKAICSARLKGGPSSAPRQPAAPRAGSSPVAGGGAILTAPRQYPTTGGRAVGNTLTPINAVAIGVSTGGPNALASIMPHIPANFQVPVFIVQHMPPVFTRLLAERLNNQCQVPVAEAVEGMQVKPGHVYLAPGGLHMVVRRDATGVRIALNQEPPENSCRPAVDVLFRSVAGVYGGGSIGVILTGMGADGVRGCECLREAGATTIVQDEATSVVWGMPGSVAEAGQADLILPLDRIVPALTQKVVRSLAA